MNSRSDRPVGHKAGFSLLEALVTLAIVAVVLGVAASLARGPSEAARLRSEASRVVGAAAAARLRAISFRMPVRFEPEVLLGEVAPCDDAEDAAIIFRPDGSTSAKDFCLTLGNASMRLRVDWLTGQLKVEPP